jgi:hypothetical protein
MTKCNAKLYSIELPAKRLNYDSKKARTLAVPCVLRLGVKFQQNWFRVLSNRAGCGVSDVTMLRCQCK